MPAPNAPAALAAALLTTLLVGVSPSSVRAQDDLLPAGEFVDQAVTLDLNGSALEFLLDEVISAIPPTLVVGALPPEEVISLILCSQDFWVENLMVHTDIHVATVQTMETSMALVLDLDLWVNVPGNPAYLVLDGCIDDVCALWMDPANVQLRLPMAFQLQTDEDGEPYVDMALGTLQQNITEAVQASLRLSSCGLTSLNGWFNENLDMNLFTYMVEGMITEIEATIDEKLLEIEVDVEEALRGLWLAGEADLLDVPLDYSVEPTSVEHSTEGLRIGLGGSVWAPRAPCIGDLDLGGSLVTPGDLPGHYDGGEHVQTWIGDELLNQAGYSIWRSGALCFEAASLGETALTTELLGLLIGDSIQTVFDELFPEGPAELVIRSIPWNPPRIRFDGAHHISIEIEDLDIEFYAPLYERWSRLASVSVDVLVGIDLGLDNDALSVEVDMGDDAISPFAQYSELHPELAPVLVDNFDGIMGLALGVLLGDIGEGFTMALPTMAGMGLSAVHFEPDGGHLDFLSGRYQLGPSTGGESAGCEGEEGCGAEGQGCSGEDSGCAAPGEGCAGDDGGCVGEDGGCDVEGGLSSAGCSGEQSETPPEQGCSGQILEAACGHAGRPRKPSSLGILLVSLLGIARRRKRSRSEAIVESSLRPDFPC